MPHTTPTWNSNKKRCVHLSFSVESDSTLWNIIFPGFDEEAVLVSRFYGLTPEAITVLQRFGKILRERLKESAVEETGSGIVISKPLSIGNTQAMATWTGLMYAISEEITTIVEEKGP